MSFGVITYKSDRAGRITLDRPSALHALNQRMCEDITDALIEWENDPDVEFILVDHQKGSRGFCAGGDIAMLAASGQKDARAAKAFFKAEYRLNNLIANYSKPYIAVMDGVTMGGGVGLAIHGSHQIATERTVFAMPETGIGLFPDAGGTWFLPRLKGELGTWLALTGEKLKGEDVLAVGLATHFCPSENISNIKEDLCRGGLATLVGLQTEADFSLADRLEEIDQMFAGNDVQTIRLRLRKGGRWARDQAHRIGQKSPVSTKITLRQLRTGRFLSGIQDALQMEYRIASRLVSSADFQEGVRARLLDKDHYPHWVPSTLHSTGADLVAQYFTPLESGELQFLETGK